jgi:hypothetical protein
VAGVVNVVENVLVNVASDQSALPAVWAATLQVPLEVQVKIFAFMEQLEVPASEMK